MKFIEIAGVSDSVFVSLAAIGRIEGGASARSGARLVLLDGMAYPVQERAEDVLKTVEIAETSTIPPRLTRQPSEPMVAASS